MQWKLIKAFEEGLKEYHLVKDANDIILLKYNSLQQSVRITSKGEHLSFFMERTGFPGTRIIFKNGYGIELGKCTFNRRHDNGHTETDNRLYRYIISGTDPAKVTIYEQDEQQLLVVCDWPFNTTHF